MTVPAIAVTDPHGPADAPLVLLGPSLGTSAILWETTIPLLAADYRVVAWDLPGHGTAPVAREPFTVAELADALAGVIGELGGPVRYAGVSLGGAVGLELALRHPSLVDRAVIVASGAKIGEPESWTERAAKVRAMSTSSLVIQSAQRWFATDSIANIPVLSGRLLHALQDADDESYALCCEALAGHDLRARLGEITTLTLALWGEHDQVAPEPKAEEIAAGVRNGRAGVIRGAAHLPPAEQPEATADALLAFFR